VTKLYYHIYSISTTFNDRTKTNPTELVEVPGLLLLETLEEEGDTGEELEWNSDSKLNICPPKNKKGMYTIMDWTVTDVYHI
jgi:hypothetical protein